MKTKRLEKLRSDDSTPAAPGPIFAFPGLQNFFSEKVRVGDAHDVPFFVSHWERGKLVEHEEFARIESSRIRWKSHEAWGRDRARRQFEGRGRHAAGRHHA